MLCSFFHAAFDRLVLVALVSPIDLIVVIRGIVMLELFKSESDCTHDVEVLAFARIVRSSDTRTIALLRGVIVAILIVACTRTANLLAHV